MSKSMESFEQHSKDIKRLLEIHKKLVGVGPGRKYDVSVLNKSAIVLITAFWEAFCEDLASEALEHIVNNSPSADALPEKLRKDIAKELKNDKHELAVWGLADGSWRTLVTARIDDMATARNRDMNTPRSGNIDELFAKAIALQGVSASWRWRGMSATKATERLNHYIGVRGAIAHRGDADNSVYKADVTTYFDHVTKLAGKTHEAVAKYLSDETSVVFV
ncbi:HEPN domain-containing protein [Clavibacter nebraskensis]|uniref:HEPN domain-containing protein n=1 Tax=Clavibacter nebraskensis TaxID=31963 RepID=UPI003CFC1CDA